MKVHLIDGTFELYRAYFGAPKVQTRAGREVGATLGLMRSFAALVAQPEVTHVACAFDHVIESFRNDLFPGYKTGEGIEPELHQQFELAERATAALGIVVWPMVEFEADDAIATAVARFSAHAAVDEVVICSPDKDMTQCLVHDGVTTWDRIRDRRLDRAGVVAKFGVSPESIPDYLALVGDTADGIPGIPRWGQKSAATVLGHYMHLERIPADAADWAVKVRGATALAQNLCELAEEARLYRKLATLRVDVPLTESLEELAYQGAVGSAFDALAAELEQTGLSNRVRYRED